MVFMSANIQFFSKSYVFDKIKVYLCPLLSGLHCMLDLIVTAYEIDR